MNKIQRKKEMLEMKKLGETNVYIGKHFGVSNERVRQIIGNFGHLGIGIIKKKCPICKIIFESYAAEKRIYCDRKCAGISKRLTSEKTIDKYSKEEKTILNKIRNDKKKEFRKEYYQRPEIKEQRKRYSHTEKYRKYQREYKKNKKNK